MKKRLQHIVLYGMHSSGRSVGRCGASRIYTDGGCPGETVEVEIDRVQRGYRYGRVNAVVNASPRRVAPFCPHYGLCGGCNWQHLAYDAQLHWKREILRQALNKYAVQTPDVPPVLPSPLTLGYRNKATYAFTHADGLSHAPAAGFHAADCRRTVCAVAECGLLPPAMQATAAAITDAARRRAIPFYNYGARSGLLKSLQLRTTTTGQLLAMPDFTTDTPRIRDCMHAFREACPDVTAWFYTLDGGAPIYVAGDAFLTERSGALTFRYSPGAFYQPNPLQAENLCAQVVAFADPQDDDRVYDLYTGVGTLACHIAGRAAAVVGVEGSADAIADASANAARNGMANVRFVAGDILQTFTDDFVAAHGRPDVLILDPPRAGTLIEIKKAILRAAPRKVVYVSCNPVSLAFDLKQLCEGYHVAAIRPIDMFPHTQHVETVALLERKAPRTAFRLTPA
ncbi:MAG: 23S rRNA (uracil(1939)-C(5))-methyltransferase RlmD [Prevotellaceae bacterium]|nr:23S rRNA (uracil(1939)-C(5))-methyltransferase RlmD [Prevotellaceae bacterium]